MNGLTETLYLRSPIWVQQVAVGVYGWWWYRRRFSKHFERLVQEFNSRENWSGEQFRAYQESKLRELFKAAANSSYYREIFSEAKITNEESPFAALARLPFLPKETLRTRAKDLLTQNPVPKGTLIQKTSGTTGIPIEFYYTPEFHALELAVPEARNLNWAGVNYRDRRVMLGVRKVCRFDQKQPPFWRFSPVEDMAYASIYHLSPEFLPAYLEFLRSYKPKVIMGYPSALQTIAQYALAHNDFPAPANGVFTTSETVTAQAREAIEEAWQCRVHDRYGAVDGCVFASQCEYGRYHLSPEVGIVEIVDREGKQCQPEEMGEVICTGLQNTLQPLIRYRIGDVARWAANQTCECKRQMPILEAIEGRFEDICYTPDGRQMLRFDTVFKGVHNICEAQVIQERPNLFLLKVVPTDGFNEEDAQRLLNNMRLHVGDVRTHVETVSSIARSSSGKFRAVVCKLSPEEKARLNNSKAN
jgi:phenylacetate-CoA ligase